jgi:hypothetical protein
MRILLTGAGGNIGTGLAPLLSDAGHDLVLSDISRPRWLHADSATPFHQLDVQLGVGLEGAAQGCELIVHTPAWHGIHTAIRTDADFWRLNVDGLQWTLDAARRAGVPRVLFISSQAWHNHYDKYGFTKRIGEELLEYHRREHGLTTVAVRPDALTPWTNDWPREYGERLLYGGVDRDDVLALLVSAIEHTRSMEPGSSLLADAVHPNPLTDDQLDRWESAPVEVAEEAFPGAARLIERWRLDVTRRPFVRPEAGWTEFGYRARHHFGTFVTTAAGMTDDEIAGFACPY